MTQFTSLIAVREFILSAYHDLPNVLFVGSLLLGSIMGYLPLVWMALGLVMNAAVIAFLQSILNLLFTGDQLVAFGASPTCQVGYERMMTGFGNRSSSPRRIAPSQWMGASVFFAVFSIYNSVRVAIRESAPGANKDLVSNRRAFSLSTLIVGLAFFLLVLARSFTGCESIMGGILGVLVGGGVAIGFWHILDVCGTGRIPDILQVVRSMAPEQKDSETPVLCTVSATNDNTAVA
jgi:hypothetical protein